jgi:hypothetical protein
MDFSMRFAVGEMSPFADFLSHAIDLVGDDSADHWVRLYISLSKQGDFQGLAHETPIVGLFHHFTVFGSTRSNTISL